jgi:hypothetical protein
MDGEELRRLVLDAAQKRAGERGAFHSKLILDDVRSHCHQNGIPFDSQALLTFFYDLFRIGYLSWGMDLSNPDPPWFTLHLKDVLLWLILVEIRQTQTGTWPISRLWLPFPRSDNLISRKPFGPSTLNASKRPL